MYVYFKELKCPDLRTYPDDDACHTPGTRSWSQDPHTAQVARYDRKPDAQVSASLHRDLHFCLDSSLGQSSVLDVDL